MASQPSHGPPYSPQKQSAGGVPNSDVDVPICSVLVVLYIIGAVSHMTILLLNRRRGHKFILSGLLFGFCMARTTTCAVRIGWAYHQQNVRLGIAAQIFVSAGVLLLFLTNIIFSQRIVRALHPEVGWHKAVTAAFTFLYISIAATLAIVITATVQSFYTLNPLIKSKDLAMQRFGTTYLLIVCALPLLILPVVLIARRKSATTAIDKFGSGRFRHKAPIVLTGAAILTIGAAWRCSNAYRSAVPMRAPTPDYFSRAQFYMFNFVIELVVVYFYAAVRVDLRFYVRDGAKGPGDYSGPRPSSDGADLEDGSSGEVGLEKDASLPPPPLPLRNGDSSREEQFSGGGAVMKESGLKESS